MNQYCWYPPSQNPINWSASIPYNYFPPQQATPPAPSLAVASQAFSASASLGEYQRTCVMQDQKIQELEGNIKELQRKLKGYQDREASSLPRYKMENRPRGVCVIINNVNFEGHEKRGGAEFDEEALEQLFRDLLFEVYVFKDLDRGEMLNVAASSASADHSNFNAFIFIVMSHGGDGDTIYGVKGRRTRVEDLMYEFKAANCPTLGNKPKLFFIQTCRGSSKETLSVVGDADVDSVQAFAGDSTLPLGVCPQEADFLLAFATAPGYKASRNPQTGSPFIQTLVKAIREHHHDHHLLDIVTEVNRRVVEKGREDLVPVQVPAPTHTLRGQLYL